MKSCVGCKYLRHIYCYHGFTTTTVVLPYTGHVMCRGNSPYTTFGFPPKVDMMRTTGPCGPERKLYQPSLWTRIKRFFRVNT